MNKERVVFHIEKVYYDLIKEGFKTSEYREFTTFWAMRILNPPRKKAWFISGYPKNNIPRLEADIIGLYTHPGYGQGQIEIKIANVKETTI